MHAGETPADAALVRRLLARQFPQWARLPVTPVPSSGTDHHIYRLGEQLAVRLPRIGWAAEQAQKEARWLPRLAPQLPLAVPTPVALGQPGDGYPFGWAVHAWLPGRDATTCPPRDLERAAGDLAAFVAALRAVSTTGAPPRPPGSRGGPLAELDEDVRAAVAALGDRIEKTAALDSWEQSLAAPGWEGPDGWLHGDLLPGNLVVVDGRLSGVIDFGGLNVGDPACDLLPAWNLFAGPSRRSFLAALDVDEATRLRGRGWALSQALIALPYYWDTNPSLVAQALRALELVLAD
jgi:aminoglycoside phosphotransferase (APT) family kinase protein